MRHDLTIEQWSRRSGLLHARDARAKLGLLVVFLIAVSSTASTSTSVPLPFLAYAVLLTLTAIAADLPVVRLAERAAWVLPFSILLAGLTWWSGDGVRAISLIEKSLLSAFATVLFVATTPVQAWSQALEQCHCPQSLLLVVQFVYRYLSLIVEQAQRMSQAAAVRGSRSRLLPKRAGFHAAAGMLGVLFARSWQRADGVYHAMLSRGFCGTFPATERRSMGFADLAFLILGSSACLLVRWLA